MVVDRFLDNVPADVLAADGLRVFKEKMRAQRVDNGFLVGLCYADALFKRSRAGSLWRNYAKWIMQRRNA